jgi:hypothetical protein
LRDEMKRIYIAGPMSGMPDFNYPAFHAEAARLRALGLHVESPAENPRQESWEAYMKASIRQMLTCDAVLLLPGWENSRGAGIEYRLAVTVGMEIVYPEVACAA